MLEALFAAAKDDTQAIPSVDFMARILQQGEAELPAPAELLTPPRRESFLRQLLSGLGGWKSVSGLATAMVAGVWIGFSSMAVLTSSVSDLLGNDNQYYLVDLEFEVAFDTGEG